MPNAPKDAFLNDYAERNTTNVVLSHLPLLFTPDTFVKNVRCLFSNHYKIYNYYFIVLYKMQY